MSTSDPTVVTTTLPSADAIEVTVFSAGKVTNTSFVPAARLRIDPVDEEITVVLASVPLE
jgi:hypothetical protein